MTTIEPRMAAAEADPERDAVYRAEEYWRELLWPEPGPLQPDQLADFATRVCSGAGWGSSTGGPAFALDVVDEDALSGWHQGMTGVIHLHPKLLFPYIVLHELAHWLRPGDGHGRQYRGTHVGLVAAGLSVPDARDLLEAYAEEGLDVDSSRFDLPADDLRTGA